MIMEQNSYVTAVDIGTTKIAAVIGSVTPTGRILIETQQCAFSQGVNKGIVVNVEDTAASIRRCLDELYKKQSIRPGKVVVGIAGRHIESRQSSAQRIRPNPRKLISEEEVNALRQQMYNIVLKPGQKILHVIPQEYTVDGMPVAKAAGCPGNVLVGNYHIVVCNTGAMDNIRMCIERCGLTMDSLVLEPIASASAVLTDEEKDAGVVLLDIGGGTSDMLIYHKNIVRSTVVIPSGGEVITRDIREVCRVSTQMAEKLKCVYGACFSECCSEDTIIPFYRDTAGREQSSITQKILAEIIDERMEQIIDAVSYTIRESGYEKEVASIVLTGGGALLKNLPQLFKLRTGFDVRVGCPKVQMESKRYTLSPIMATSVGLMMAGYRGERHGKTKIEKIIERIPIVGKAKGVLKELFDEKSDNHYLS
jgi:cell division protein FtsA